MKSIQIRKYIYETLKNAGIVDVERVWTWSEDETDGKMLSDDNFPCITYQKISSQVKNNTVGVRREVWQISAWSFSLLESEKMQEKIIKIFNRHPRSDIFVSCDLLETAHTHNTDAKIHAMHARFLVVIYDADY